MISDALLIIVDLGLGLFAAFMLIWNALKMREIHLSISNRLDQIITSTINERRAANVESGRLTEVLRKSQEIRETERDDSLKKKD